MNSDGYIYLVLFLLFLFFSYEFTLIENAYFNLSTHRIKKLEEKEVKNLVTIKELHNNKKFYSTILIADYFSNAISALSFGLLLNVLYGFKGFIFSALLSPILIIIFGEMLPKSMAIQKYEKIVVKKTKLCSIIYLVLRPLVFIVDGLYSILAIVTRTHKNYEVPLITEDDLIDAFSLGMEEGILNKDESFFIENVFEFKDSLAKDIMTPRTDVIAVSLDDSYGEIIKIIKEEAFSRMPVYDGDLDNIVGILHVKDLLTISEKSTLRDNLDILKKTFYTFEFKPIGELFDEMRKNKISIAIVNDEYGGTEGLITMEDLIEKIVGSISDEYDEDEDEDIIKLGPSEYLIDGSMNLSNLNQILNLDLQSDETESIAGYIIENIDRFPKKDEILKIGDLQFKIKETSKNRIEKVTLKL
ncbi:hemolysin family protein [Anaerosphaera multitolerans]|uniref:HlyC/CorC family transporter n=1 Tax=Anaerosphaera multitolerans TaxID=2487351 RepID=A0A437S831_9FIRM|nr:hemolysin family protein [Anaerosphaera multitolerans]RVU55240.1 HlyC/CorC family transporter [Anaerosphaera multitolerans]